MNPQGIDRIHWDDLPASVQDLAEVIGLTAAMQIVDAFGGRRVCVPVAEHPDHPLARLLGPRAFHRLVATYRGEELEVPTCALAKRRAEATAFFRAGGGTTAGAVKLGMTRQGARRLLRRLEQDGRVVDPQLGLFDDE